LTGAIDNVTHTNGIVAVLAIVKVLFEGFANGRKSQFLPGNFRFGKESDF
jgi:hypothetical protein